MNIRTIWVKFFFELINYFSPSLMDTVKPGMQRDVCDAIPLHGCAWCSSVQVRKGIVIAP